MSWLIVHKQYTRITFMALLLVALSGTWAYDLIHVPAQYDCSLPNVRLRGDFCGIPFSVFDHYRVIVAPLFEHVWDSDSQLAAIQAIIIIFRSSGQASLPLRCIRCLAVITALSLYLTESTWPCVIWSVGLRTMWHFGSGLLLPPAVATADFGNRRPFIPLIVHTPHGTFPNRAVYVK
jgi:hypothetical protein